MSALRRFCPVVLFVLLALVLYVSRDVSGAPPTKEQIAKLVKQLGDNDFDTREAATQKLWEVGEIAEEALKVAAKSDDAEVSRRANEVLQKFKWGLYPDTPKKVADLIERYQSADASVKPTLIRALFEAGTPGCKALLKIAKAENDAQVRANLIAQIANDLPRTVPLLLDDNNPAVLERLVEIGLDHQLRTGIPHYAAYCVLSGKLGERIAQFQALEEKSTNPKREAEILAYLHRAKGDLPAAVEAAKRAGVEDLVDQLLAQAGDWKKLAERKALADPGDEIERLGRRAAYFRLTGQEKGLNETIAELIKLTEGQKDNANYFLVTKALLLNDRTDKALEILTKGDDQLMAFEILCARNQYKEAINLVDKVRFEGKEAPALELAQARTLYLLGAKDKAAPIFAKFAGMIKEGTDVSWYEDLVEAEFRAGLTDAAFEHAAKVLSISKDQGWAPRLFGKLYPGKKQTAEQVWGWLSRLAPNEEPVARMKRLRALLDGKAAAKDVMAFLDEVEKVPRDRPAGPDAPLLPLGEVALAAKLDERAVALFQKADSDDGWLRAGDVLAEKKQWGQAAEAYRKSWQADRSNPLPLWLAGWALTHAGKGIAQPEGKKLMEQAHWLPMGAEIVRHQFALDLVKRKHADASRRENELILKVGQPGSFYSGEATRRLAIAALMRRDFAASVEGHEKAMLCVLGSSINFVQKQAYVIVPAAVHKQRAAALLKAGKTKEALDEARACYATMPGYIDLPVLLVPDLEKLGMKKEADELFEKALKLHEDLCREYPNSSFAHNSVAWLRVCCNRDLDQALEHAVKATKLAPTHAGHHDTLAEAYFQRGDRAKALEIQKKVIELDPRRPYFRKQLKRIEAGDPKAERPMEEDDEDDED